MDAVNSLPILFPSTLLPSHKPPFFLGMCTIGRIPYVKCEITWTRIFITALFIIAKDRKQWKCSSIGD